MIRNNPSITQAKLAQQLNVSLRTVKRMLSKLQDEGIVVREGSNRLGKWIVVKR